MKGGVTERRTRIADDRYRRWYMAEKPFYQQCTICNLDCKQIGRNVQGAFDLKSCPVKDKGSSFFMKKDRGDTK